MVRKRLSICIAAAAALALLNSCQPNPPRNANSAAASPRAHDPAVLSTLLISTTTPDDSRKAADRQLVELQGPNDESRLALLEQILFASGHSDTMRNYALDQLAAANPNRAANALDLYLPRLKGENLAVLRHACELATRLADPRLLDPLVRSVADALDARTTMPADDWFRRPEHAAIAALSGKEVREALVDVVVKGTVTNRRTARIAALDIVSLLKTPAEFRASLPAQANPSDVWLADVRWWLDTFNAIPFTENESNWIATLRKPEHASLITRARDRHRRLTAMPHYRPTPRHIQALAYAPEASIDPPVGLLEIVRGRLKARPHTRRAADYPGSPEDLSGELPDAINHADLLAVDLVLTALDKPATLTEIYRLGMADMSDTTTEHGGLLSFLNVNLPVPIFAPHPPLFTTNDFEYITGDALLRATPTGIAHYHFHFQQIHNAERAGPGVGDLSYARKNRVNCVLFTSTGPKEFNVDFYTPDGVLVDLGTYKVP